MKKILFALFLLLAIQFTQTASAQLYKSAIGIRLSSAPAIVNNGITFKYFLNETNAIEAILSLNDPVALGALFEVHKQLGTPGLQWFYGAGAYLSFSTMANLGAQGIVGLDYKFANIPLNLTLDWKPELNLIEQINFEPAAIGFSLRFTFGSAASE